MAGRLKPDDPVTPERPTWQLVERVRNHLAAKQGRPATDYQIAAALDVAPQTVGGYRRGGAMPNAIIARACDVTGENPFEWFVRISGEREPAPEARRVWIDASDDLQRLKAGKKPKRGGLVDTLTRGVREPVAALLAAILAGLSLLGAPQPAAASDITGLGYVIDRVIYYTQIGSRGPGAPAVPGPATIRASA